MKKSEKEEILITFGDNDTYPLWYFTGGLKVYVLMLRSVNYRLLGDRLVYKPVKDKIEPESTYRKYIQPLQGVDTVKKKKCDPYISPTPPDQNENITISKKILKT